MPFKDAAPFLEQAAASVLSQTWPDVELVLVDDGGTDGGDAIAERVRATDPGRVRLVSHPNRANRGIGASRRLGFDTASGEIQANLDGDDVWEPSHLEHEVGLLLRSPGADMVHGRAWEWFSWSGSPQADAVHPPPFAPGVVVPGQRLLGAILRNGGYAAPPCAVLFRASLLGAWTSVLDDFPGMYEDQVLHAGLQLRGNAVISGSTTAWYRQHAGSISAQELLPDPLSRFDRGRSAFLQHLSEHPLIDDPEVRGQVERNVRELQERSLRIVEASDVPTRPVPAGLRRVVRRVRTSASAAVRRSEILLERRRPGATAAGLAADQARAARLGRLFLRQGADLCGDVLALGRREDLPDAVLAAALQVRSLPRLPAPPGPQHPLAELPTAAFDGVVLVEGLGDVCERHELRHLRRSLRPGGVLWLLPHLPRPELEPLLHELFDVDLVRPYRQREPGPARHPLLALRAAVPACPVTTPGPAG